MKLHRYVQGAIDYAAADKSDPFAKSRALSHVYNGLAGYSNRTKDEINNNFALTGRERVEDCYYSADRTHETRSMPDGEKYTVPAFRNVKVI